MQPSDDFYVTDNAGTLSESTKELIDLASGPLEQECNGAQICVVTINYLPSGYDSEPVRLAAFQRLGHRQRNRQQRHAPAPRCAGGPRLARRRQGLTNYIGTDEINSLLDEYFWPYSDAGEYDEAVATLFPHLIDVYEDIYGVELYGGTSDSQSGQGGGYYDDGTTTGTMTTPITATPCSA